MWLASGVRGVGTRYVSVVTCLQERFFSLSPQRVRITYTVSYLHDKMV